jgi:hypothetical protein
MEKPLAPGKSGQLHRKKQGFLNIWSGIAPGRRSVGANLLKLERGRASIYPVDRKSGVAMVTFQLIGAGFVLLFFAALVSSNEAAPSR